MKRVKRGMCLVLSTAVALGSMALSGCSSDAGSSGTEPKGRRDEIQKAGAVSQGVNLVPAKKKAGRR
jgi:hypothetical protein